MLFIFICFLEIHLNKTFLFKMVEFVSIGPYCDTTEILKLFGLRNKSYPFDWIF